MTARRDSAAAVATCQGDAVAVMMSSAGTSRRRESEEAFFSHLATVIMRAVKG